MIADFAKKQKRSSSKSKFPLALVIILCLGVCVILVFADIKIYQRKQELNLQLENLKKQVEEIKKNNGQLKEGISKVDDQDYIEKVAREQLDLQKNNEKVTVFLMPKEQDVPANNQSQQKSWLGRISEFWQKLFK